MALQQLRDCSINVGGSYSNVVTLNLCTHSYYQRAVQSTSTGRTSEPSLSSAELGVQLLIQAKRLQDSAKELSLELKLMIKPLRECEDLANTLDELADIAIPSILQVSIDGFSHQLDEPRELKTSTEIAYMQGILDDFRRKPTKDYERALQSMRSTFTSECLLERLWRYFWCLLLARYLITTVRESLIASRDRIYAALFSPMSLSTSTQVRIHQIEVVDFYGAQWSLPQDLCLNRKVFFSILQFKFQGGLGEEVIRAKRFNVFQQYSAHPIMTDDWESTVKNSDLLQLSVLVTQQPPLQSADSPSPECPRCERSHKVVISDPGRNWATCLQCNTHFNSAPIRPEEKPVWDDIEESQVIMCFLWEKWLCSNRNNLTPFCCFSIRNYRANYARGTRRASDLILHPYRGSSNPEDYASPNTFTPTSTRPAYSAARTSPLMNWDDGEAPICDSQTTTDTPAASVEPWTCPSETNHSPSTGTSSLISSRLVQSADFPSRG